MLHQMFILQYCIGPSKVQANIVHGVLTHTHNLDLRWKTTWGTTRDFKIETYFYVEDKYSITSNFNTVQSSKIYELSLKTNARYWVKCFPSFKILTSKEEHNKTQ